MHAAVIGLTYQWLEINWVAVLKFHSTVKWKLIWSEGAKKKKKILEKRADHRHTNRTEFSADALRALQFHFSGCECAEVVTDLTNKPLLYQRRYVYITWASAIWKGLWPCRLPRKWYFQECYWPFLLPLTRDKRAAGQTVKKNCHNISQWTQEKDVRQLNVGSLKCPNHYFGEKIKVTNTIQYIVAVLPCRYMQEVFYVPLFQKIATAKRTKTLNGEIVWIQCKHILNNQW